jgi:stage II sporulation protein E
MLMRADIANADDTLLYEIGELGEVSEDSLRMAYYGGYLADSLRSAALAAEFRAISEYLAGIMTENEQSFSTDRDAENKIREIIEARLPDRALSVSVLGKEIQRIVISSSDKSVLNRDREEIRRAVTHACGFAVTEGETEELDGRAMLIFNRAPVLSATFAGRKRNSVGEEEFCGDSYGVIADEERSFAFISDGMGSGREAAVTSGLCTLFLQKLLPINGFAGDCVGATLDALNGFLCGRNGAGLRECAATVDLASLDLVACKAVFYKCGAAPTYIFRDGALFKVRSRTVPIGIVREPDIGKINMELLPGDVIVMVSDGVTQGREECPELFELLRSRLLTHSSEQLADAVMDYAEQQGCTDDVSVLVIKISENDRIFSAAESA